MLLLGILVIIFLISISTFESKKEKSHAPLYLSIITDNDHNTSSIYLRKNDIHSSIDSDIDSFQETVTLDSLGISTQDSNIPLIFTRELKDESSINLDNNIKISKSYLFDLISVNNKSNESLSYMVILLTYIFILSLSNYIELNNLINDNYSIFYGLFTVNTTTNLFEVIILFFSILILFSFNNIKFENNLSDFENISNNQSIIVPTDSFGIIGLFSVLGGLLLVDNSNLILLFISIELQSYALYIIAATYKHSFSSTDSGLKYFLLGGLASVFILLGCGLIYSATGSIDLNSLYLLLNLGYYNNSIVTGSIFLILGLLLKLSSAPMHGWSADVYDGVPTIVTTWLSVLTKMSILGFLVQFIHKVINNATEKFNFDITPSSSNLLSLDNLSGLGLDFKDFILNFNLSPELPIYSILLVVFICAGLSMMIGAISGLKEVNIKRLFAFSGVTNIGYLLVALTYTENSSSLIFYMVQYSISNLNLFLIVLLLGYGFSSPYNPYSFKNWKLNIDTYSPIRFTSQLTGMFYTYPYLAISFAITLFSLIGIPPLAGFYGKYFIIVDCMKYHTSASIITFVLITASVITSFFYLRLIKIVFTPVNSIKELYSEADGVVAITSNNFLSKDEESYNINVESTDLDNITLAKEYDLDDSDYDNYSENELLDYNYADESNIVRNVGLYHEDVSHIYNESFDQSFYGSNAQDSVFSEINNLVGLDALDNSSIKNDNYSTKFLSFDSISAIIAFNTSFLIGFFLFSEEILNLF